MMVESIPLLDINFSKLKLVKESLTTIGSQDHRRWVFISSEPKNTFSDPQNFIKIWNVNYVRKDTIIDALSVGFYDESNVAALKALIFHHGVCRGYIINSCNIDYRFNEYFYEKLKQKTIEHKYYAIQFSPYHMGLYKNNYSLFDLEGVHPLDELPNMKKQRAYFDYQKYGEFVAEQFIETFPDRKKELGEYYFLRNESFVSKVNYELTQRSDLIRKLKIKKTQINQHLRANKSTNSIELIDTV